MQDHAIIAEQLHFSYQREQALIQDLSLQVPQGAIYGFLGHNGAGKSTTIRLLLGLLRPASGRVRLLGHSPRRRDRAVFRRVGALIESPALYDHLSAAENLEIAATYRDVPADRIPAVLEIIGLRDTARKPVRAFSTGMRQRLGLGLALLHDPDLIILDEPTNGLDPQGIAEVRTIIQRINQELGKTIFVSSHLLSEIELIATQVGIIKAGRRLYEGPIEQLRQLREGGLQVAIRTDDLPRTRALIEGQFPCRLNCEYLYVNLDEQQQIAALNQALVEARLAVYEIKQIQPPLEQLFLDITQQEKTA